MLDTLGLLQDPFSVLLCALGGSASAGRRSCVCFPSHFQVDQPWEAPANAGGRRGWCVYVPAPHEGPVGQKMSGQHFCPQGSLPKATALTQPELFP